MSTIASNTGVPSGNRDHGVNTSNSSQPRPQQTGDSESKSISVSLFLPHSLYSLFFLFLKCLYLRLFSPMFSILLSTFHLWTYLLCTLLSLFSCFSLEINVYLTMCYVCSLLHTFQVSPWPRVLPLALSPLHCSLALWHLVPNCFTVTMQPSLFPVDNRNSKQLPSALLAGGLACRRNRKHCLRSKSNSRRWLNMFI